MEQISQDEVMIAELWLGHFGSPLPMHGAKDIAIQILQEEGVSIPALSDAEQSKKAKPVRRQRRRG